MGRKVATAIIAVGLAFSAIGCRATVGNVSLWARPAISIPPRAMEMGDGTEYMYIERYEPSGDAMFIMVRIYPKIAKDNQSLINSDIRNWPDKLLKKLKTDD